MDIFYFDINLKPIKILDTLLVSHYQETSQLNGQITSTLTSTYYPEIRNAEYFGSKDVDNPNDFRIYKIINQSAFNHQMTSNGIHKFFDDLKSGVVRDIRAQNVSAREALSRILYNANSDWELGLNYTSNAYASSSYYRQSLLSAFWDLVETWNIEFKPRITFSNGEITGQYIDIYDRVSEDYGKMYDTKDKLISVVEDSDRSELYTALIGYGKGEQVGDGWGRGIDFEDVQWSTINGDPVNKPYNNDYVENPVAVAEYGFRLGIVEFSDEEVPSRLLERTWNQLQITSRPKREFSTQVSETEHVELGEIVGITDNAIDIRYKTRIYELTRDFLVRGIKQIKFGDKVVVSSAERIKQQEKQNIELVEQTTQSMYEQIMDSIIIDFNNEDAYMYNLEIGNPYGLPAGEYSFDRPIDQNPTKVVYQGAGQILIANSKLPNGEWNWTTALDADGLGAEIIGALSIYASQIISGNLTLTDNLKIVDQYGNDVLYIDSSGRVILNASNMVNQSDLDDLTESNAKTADRISELQTEWETKLEYTEDNLQTSISDIQNQYLADLDSWSDKISENELGLSTLSSRVVAVETDLGENSVRWNAIDNSMIFANEGLFVGNVATNTGSWIRSSGSFDITLDGNTVGSFSKDGLATEAIVTGTMQIGNYIHNSLSDGSMVIQWVS